MMRFRTVAATVALVTTLSGCWMQPGFDAGNTRWNPGATTIAPANAGGLSEVWSYHVGNGPVLEVLSNGSDVFALANTNDTGEALAVDLAIATGEHRWTYSRVVGDILYGFTLTNPVYIDGRLEARWNEVRVPGLILTGGGGRVAIDASTGEELEFSYSPDGGSYTSVRSHLGLALLDTVPSTRVEWVCDANATGGGPAFAFVGLDLMWSTANSAQGFRDCDPATGEWGSTWTTDLGARPKVVAAVGADAVAYLDDSGTLSMLDATTGAIRWTAEVGNARGLAVADGKVLVRSRTSPSLLAYAADTGALLWEAPLATIDGTDPSVGGDVVYMSVRQATNDENLLAFDLADGSQLASLPVGASGERVSTGPIVDGGRVVVGTSTGRVVAFGLPG